MGTATDASAGGNAAVSSVESERQPHHHHHHHHPSPPPLSVLSEIQNRMPSVGSGGGGCGKYEGQIDELIGADGGY